MMHTTPLPASGLTLNPQDAEGHAEPISLSRDNRPARIVWLDDEPTIHDVAKVIFDSTFKDYALVQCSTGDEAWEELLREAPDIFFAILWRSRGGVCRRKEGCISRCRLAC